MSPKWGLLRGKIKLFINTIKSYRLGLIFWRPDILFFLKCWFPVISKNCFVHHFSLELFLEDMWIYFSSAYPPKRELQYKNCICLLKQKSQHQILHLIYQNQNYICFKPLLVVSRVTYLRSDKGESWINWNSASSW